MDEFSKERPKQPGRGFRTTHWSLVTAASANSAEALEELCQAYWSPLHLYAHRLGLGAAEAEDLTQAFFTRMLDKNLLAIADSGRGRFRTFLLTAFRRFIVNEWKHENTLKRGGGTTRTSLNLDNLTNTFASKSNCDLSHDRLYEREWAMTVLQRSFQNLASEYAASNQTELFEALSPLLTADDNGTYQTLATRLDSTAGALRMAASRLRSRWREQIRSEIRKTVANDSEVDDEILSLFQALRP